MGIADLFRPKYRHSDVRVRTEAVRALTSDDAATLIQVARTDRDIGVRRIAIEKIDKADALAEIAAAETERSLRDFAGERAAKLWTSVACGEDADAAANALSGIIKLGDHHALAEVAVHGDDAAIRKRAFGELRDPRALADLAKRDAPQDIRLAAVARIDDGDVLRALAIDTTSKEVGLAAVEKLDDKDRLDNIAQKAKNKAVRQRARKIVQEIDAAEAAKKPGVPDEVKRKKAEQAQLIREVEGVADSFDFDKAEQTIRAAEDAWGKLGVTDPRFTKAVERFWKRKELHDQQARSSQELRVIEREAREEKERAAKERVEAAPPPAEPAEPAPVADDPRKAEKEAEKQRRADEQAARDAKKKEDAERSTAIAASLTALCEDMEKLADSKDGRAIERLLEQASKAFGQIGKVVGEDRDKLGDRYTAARGKLVVRVKDLREAEDWKRFQNVPKAEALIATAKELLAAPEVPDLGNRLRQLQALWKEVGPMPQRRSKELWEQFKGVCDQIFEKVKGVRAVEQEKFGEVAKTKEALIAQAETLSESTEWAATAEKLKALQAEWKQSGYLPRKQGDELWKRFRAACDKFFERRKPMLDERRAEEGKNLEAKQALIARAHAIAVAAPGDGGWGKAIRDIQELQKQWREIGFVPRRDADAVFKAFRKACDALFEKRDAARDSEANAHRAERDAAKAQIDAVMMGGDDVVTRALAARDKAKELGGLAREVEDMIRHVIASHPDEVKGTDLDPAVLRSRRAKIIDKVLDLLPKQPTHVSAGAAPGDIAAQLKQAMRANAFGELRFSGRDPVELLEELRVQWNEYGPIVDDEDRAQLAAFQDACTKVVEAFGAEARFDERSEGGTRDERVQRPKRARRQRASGEIAMPPTEPVATPPAPAMAAPPAPAMAAPPAPAMAAPPATAVPQTAHDAITAPAQIPFEPLPPPPVPAVPPPAPAPAAAAPEPARAKPVTELPPMDELDTGWDMPESDPTAKPDEPEPPSASEMAGDSATGGDGIDEPGWD